MERRRREEAVAVNPETHLTEEQRKAVGECREPDPAAWLVLLVKSEKHSAALHQQRCHLHNTDVEGE